MKVHSVEKCSHVIDDGKYEITFIEDEITYQPKSPDPTLDKDQIIQALCEYIVRRLKL